jgi:ABC-type uncharacterized transport system involved in gliding motility auxiliary subunit
MAMKSLAIYQKYLKYLALPGLALTTAGLLSGILAGWTLLPAGLLVGGIGLLLLGLVLGNPGQGRFWAQRSTEAGANALVATLAVLAILGLVNFLAVRYASRVDLTENQIFTLAPQSQQVVQELFVYYQAQPTEMAEGFAARSATLAGTPAEAAARARVVADYIAGMTDRFATREHERLSGRRLLP